MTQTQDPTTTWWRAPAEFLLRISAATGLGVSLILLWEATHDGAQFCGPGGGCDVVGASAWAKPLGVPMAAYGTLYFAVALLLIHLKGMRKHLVLLALAGGAGAISLLVIQGAIIETFCEYCVVVDVSAIAMALAAVALREKDPIDSRSPLYVPLVLMTAIGLLAPPTVATLTRPRHGGKCKFKPEADKDPVLKAQVPGKVTIVEFLDFGCPFCKKLHVKLKPVLAKYGDKVVMVRKYWPMHREAIFAAVAAVCADKLGKGDEMADELFEAEDLGPDNMTVLADKVGMDKAAFDKCMESEYPKNQIRKFNEERKILQLEGLPSMFIGEDCYQGVQTERTIKRSIERARSRL